jgi:hypothetical protein
MSGLAERCRQASLLDRSEKLELVGEILSLGKDRKQDLEELMKSADCPAVFRCAAIDQYVQQCLSQEAETGPPPHAQVAWLQELFNSEEDEDVRTRLYTVLSYFSQKEWTTTVRVKGATPVRTRGAVKRRTPRGSAPADWRERASRDPSPRLRWLASLQD